MRLSTLFGRTLREYPNEAESAAHQLVLRAGLVRALLAGGYVLMPLGMQVVRRIATMIHTEMMRIGGQEFRTPIIQSATAWEQTGRYDEYGPLMLRMTDRNERALVVAPTHEEAVAEVARREITSYRQMPTLIYQIHTKYRDEIRTHGGLLRTREFTMLKAYSLDADEAGLDHAYEQTAQAFAQILVQCGVEYITVEAIVDTTGACKSHTYMVISPAGDETMALCSLCGYAANLKIAMRAAHTPVDTANAPAMELIAAPHCATVADLATHLDIHPAATAKAVFFTTPEQGLLFVVIRGDLEVNETKLRAVAGVSALAPASIEQIVATGAVPGYASPVGLHGVTVIADHSVVTAGPLVAGANQAGYHLRNVVYGRDWQATQTADIATVRTGDPCPCCRGPLALEHGIEIGHIAKLGTRYTKALGATYLNAQGAAQPIVMGSYGIGIERLIQVIVEQHHDEAGIVWPATVAPADVQLVRLGKKEQISRIADELYTQLRAAGVRVLYDDRDESAGVKFNDADLIGLPVRLLISERLLATDSVEIKPRAGTAVHVRRTEVLAAVRTMLAGRPSD